MSDHEKLEEMKKKMEEAVEQRLVLFGIDPESEERKKRCERVAFKIGDAETIAFTIDSLPVVWLEITENPDKTLNIKLYTVDSTLPGPPKSIN